MGTYLLWGSEEEGRERRKGREEERKGKGGNGRHRPWKRPKFDPSPHQNPLTDVHQNWQA